MSKKRLIVVCALALVAILLNIYILKLGRIGSIEKMETTLSAQVRADFVGIFDVFYSDNTEFDATKSAQAEYKEAGTTTTLTFDIQTMRYIRLDVGEYEGVVNISKLSISAYGEEIDLLPFVEEQADQITRNDISELSATNGNIQIETEAGDAYFVFELLDRNVQGTLDDVLAKKSRVWNIVFCVIMDLLMLYAIFHIKELTEIPREIISSKALIGSLAKNDFKMKFAGSYLGIIWAFVQPVITIVVYWFVFEVGLRAGKTSEYPFILYLMAGLVPWFYFSEALNGGTSALLEYNYLVKKVVFKISILPVVKVTSSIFVHIFFIAFVFCMCWGYGYTPDLYSLQIIYYVICSYVLILGISYMTAAAVVFFKDLLQIINIILNVGIWVTPIMWNPVGTISPTLHTIFKINPVYYIVDGFRDALLAKEWFFDKPIWTCYFWLFTAVMFGIGVTVFKKLKVHFADVL